VIQDSSIAGLPWRMLRLRRRSDLGCHGVAGRGGLPGSGAPHPTVAGNPPMPKSDLRRPHPSLEFVLDSSCDPSEQ
jgi:hypothetical protein